MAQVKSLKIFILFLFSSYSIYGYCEQISTTNLVIKDGMSSNYVTDITQDKYGFIWFATRHGVSRFDGSKFTTYVKGSDQVPLNSNDIIRIVADTLNNKVWIANRWAGLNIFDCEMQTFSSFTHDRNDNNSISSDAITDVMVSSKGEIWIATKDNGINKFDSKNKRFIRYNQTTLPELPSNKILCLAEGTNGDIYIGHLEDGLSVFSPDDHTIRNFKTRPGDRNSLPDNMVHTVYAGMDSKIWIGSSKGLSLFDPVTETFRNFCDVKGLHPTIQHAILCINITSDGRIWAGTQSDLCYFDVKNTDKILSGGMGVKHMYIQDLYWGISNPTVYCVFEDSFRNIWIGSNGGGGSFISHKKPFFKTWQTEKIPGIVNGLNDKEIMTICVAQDGSIWLGTDGGGINVYKDGKRHCVYSATTKATSSLAYSSSLTDSNNDLWFGAAYGDGIDIYRNQKKVFTHYQLQAHRANIYALFEDDKRNIWIGTNRGIEIYNLDTKEKKVINTGNSKLPTNEIRSIAQDKEGNIWIGTLSNGMIIYNYKKNKIQCINEQTVLRNNSINQIFRDSKDRMWVATCEELVLFPDIHSDNHTVFNTDNGLASSSISAITEDNKGNIWLSTHVGISCYIESENKFSNFDYSDGTLYGNYMNHSVAKTKDGTIYFGSLNGVCYFNPSEKPSDIALPPVVFTGFKVHGKNYPDQITDVLLPIPDCKVSLNHHQDIFSVSFNVMDKSLQGVVEYAYWLEGLSNTWTNIGKENLVTFRNIPYRKYKLHVRARYKNLQWQENNAVLDIHIQPPLWLTWWAKLIYVLLLTCTTFFIFYSYKKRLELHRSLSFEKENTRRQQELNEERLKFYTNITHELRTPLTLILGPLEDLQCDTNTSQGQQTKLSLIHKNTIRLLNLVKQILEFRKTETQNKKLCVIQGDIAEKVKEIGLKYKELNRNSDVSMTINIQTDKTQLYFDPEVITMILDNLLSNALKYTQQGSITLSLYSIKIDGVEYTEIEIADTGMGIPEEDVSHIFERYYQSNKNKKISGFGIGLALVKNLVDLHEGYILVESKMGKGTTFKFRLLNNNLYAEAIHVNSYSRDIEDANSDKPIILIVEDESDICDYIADSLSDTYEIIVAENGEQGLEMALSSIPDVIVSDIMMPIKNGVELCQEIKRHVETSHIPVILLTAKDTVQDKTQGYDAGADSYITKPFSASLLKSRVSNILETRKKIAALISSSTSFKHAIIVDSLNRMDTEFIERITKVVEDNLIDERIDIPFIAKELSMSYSSLYRKIKALTGMSTGEFIRKVRIRKAEQLLLSGKYNISEITHQVGLNSVSYFRECFKDEYGMSPSEYLKKIKEG